MAEKESYDGGRVDVEGPSTVAKQTYDGGRVFKGEGEINFVEREQGFRARVRKEVGKIKNYIKKDQMPIYLTRAARFH